MSLLPELASAPDVPPPPPAPDAWGESRLFDALKLALTTSDKSGPVVLLIDDAQWADSASLAFLTYLAHRLDETPLVLVVGHGEVAVASPLRDLVGRDTPDLTIELKPLTAGDIAPLLPDQSEAPTVIQRTGGIPLLVTEALASPEAELTPGFRTFMRHRMAEIDQLGAQILAAAAVIGASASMRLLRAVSGRSPDEVVDAVEQLMQVGILREAADGDGVEYALGMAQQLIYEETSPVRRQLLHGRAAAALSEQLHAADDARTATAVANHLKLSDTPADATAWFLRAGDLAREVFAYSEAEEAYRAALALGAEPQDTLHLALGDLEVIVGRHRQALAEFQVAATTTDAATRALAEHRMGEAHRSLGHFDLAGRHFELAEEHHPRPWLLHADWALLYFRLGAVGDAAAMGTRAVKEASEFGDDKALARAENVLGIVTDDVDKAEAHLRRSLQLAGADPMLRMAALNSLAYRIGRAGNEAEAVTLVEEALELAQRIGDRHREAALHNHLADLYHRKGDDDASEQALLAAVRLFADLEPGSMEPEVWLLSQW